MASHLSDMWKRHLLKNRYEAHFTLSSTDVYMKQKKILMTKCIFQTAGAALNSKVSFNSRAEYNH